ncbi:hypothetical protein L596_011597 [Steinernema carpocapsae]|uniref:Uncharacterized protein n=1 Tax=Steinernema carpocapsae TaxID=34508 RepID=A0A4V6A4J2_STECR|nr:hypothetical protein L596_011597 [Steinernema carpocapsae]
MYNCVLLSLHERINALFTAPGSNFTMISKARKGHVGWVVFVFCTPKYWFELSGFSIIVDLEKGKQIFRVREGVFEHWTMEPYLGYADSRL